MKITRNLFLITATTTEILQKSYLQNNFTNKFSNQKSHKNYFITFDKNYLSLPKTIKDKRGFKEVSAFAIDRQQFKMSIEHKHFVLFLFGAASVTFVLMISCQGDKEINANTFALENILASNDEMLSSEKVKKIFFIESHTERKRDLKNHRRQVCSIESAGGIFFYF